jgi:hypothetical protein
MPSENCTGQELQNTLVVKLLAHSRSVFCLAPYHPDLKPIKNCVYGEGIGSIEKHFI